MLLQGVCGQGIQVQLFEMKDPEYKRRKSELNWQQNLHVA